MLKQAARKATSLRFWRAGIRLADASSSKGFEAVRKVCSEEAFNVTHLDCFAKRIFLMVAAQILLCSRCASSTWASIVDRLRGSRAGLRRVQPAG